MSAAHPKIERIFLPIPPIPLRPRAPRPLSSDPCPRDPPPPYRRHPLLALLPFCAAGPRRRALLRRPIAADHRSLLAASRSLCTGGEAHDGTSWRRAGASLHERRSPRRHVKEKASAASAGEGASLYCSWRRSTARHLCCSWRRSTTRRRLMTQINQALKSKLHARSVSMLLLAGSFFSDGSPLSTSLLLQQSN
ncbi:hypothetical protein PVAP13_3NG187900 [Panicum virgatum]|uniref:Uncharacterized protein n=1 Tax=Panicum virgatum TaxID=38727 RepID=A0A8T0UFT5_PANVG|nr:hypothetical protein PVAP13_3NG187900 [Panicum virgatum]